jgi:hypothetical protein
MTSLVAKPSRSRGLPLDIAIIVVGVRFVVPPLCELLLLSFIHVFSGNLVGNSNCVHGLGLFTDTWVAYRNQQTKPEQRDNDRETIPAPGAYIGILFMMATIARMSRFRRCRAKFSVMVSRYLTSIRRLSLSKSFMPTTSTSRSGWKSRLFSRMKISSSCFNFWMSSTVVS